MTTDVTLQTGSIVVFGTVLQTGTPTRCLFYDRSEGRQAPGGEPGAKKT